MISPSNSLSLLLHADGTKGLQNDQRFLLRFSVTREPAYFLANDGSAIYDGRMKGSLAPPPIPSAPKRNPGRVGIAPSGPAGPGIFSTRGSTGLGGQMMFGPKQNNQISSVHHHPNGPADTVANDFASESEKYKIMTYEEDILLEQVS